MGTRNGARNGPDLGGQGGPGRAGRVAGNRACEGDLADLGSRTGVRFGPVLGPFLAPKKWSFPEAILGHFRAQIGLRFRASKGRGPERPRRGGGPLGGSDSVSMGIGVNDDTHILEMSINHDDADVTVRNDDNYEKPMYHHYIIMLRTILS